MRRVEEGEVRTSEEDEGGGGMASFKGGEKLSV